MSLQLLPTLTITVNHNDWTIGLTLLYKDSAPAAVPVPD